jgi:hypothetical protein
LDLKNMETFLPVSERTNKLLMRKVGGQSTHLYIHDI